MIYVLFVTFIINHCIYVLWSNKYFLILILTEKDSVMHFLRECSHTSMTVKRQELCNLIKYALRLDWLSNITLADYCLLAILKIVCEMYDLIINFLSNKR